MNSFEDLSGKKFGKLTAIRRTDDYISPSGHHATRWLCQCDCGNTVYIAAHQLKSGKTKSCGCYQKERASESNRTHGLSKERLYFTWKDMRSRCQNPRSKEYANYGGRGILLCKEWEDYLKFREWALSHGYQENLTIDRIDNDKGYCPENCRWATRTQQNRNMRRNHHVTYHGKDYIAAELARKAGIGKSVFLNRIMNEGFTVEEAVELPAIRGKSKRQLTDISERIKEQNERAIYKNAD